MALEFSRAAALSAVLSPGTEVFRYMQRKEKAIYSAASAIAGKEVRHTNTKPNDYHLSFVSRTEREGDELVVQVGNFAEHAGYIEHGTAPHVIRPRRARMLRFEARSGETVFAFKVNHPGTRAYHVLERALGQGARA